MNKTYVLFLLLLCVSCRMNTSPHTESVEIVETELDETGYYDQLEGMLILEKLGKVYGNDPHISRLSLETPNCPDFIEGIYFDNADLVFQVKGNVRSVRKVLEEASGSSNFRLEPIDRKNYSQKELRAIQEELSENFKKLNNRSVKRNIKSFGAGLRHIEIELIVNTPEKRGEFLKKVMSSPAFRFTGREFPVINEMVAVSDTLGIYLRPEYPVFSTELEEITFILDNYSGAEVICGDEYSITFEDEKNIWRELPINDNFNLIAYVIEDKEQRVMKAFLYPDVYSGKPGRYRFFYNVRRNEQPIMMMAEFRLTSDEIELKAAKKKVLPMMPN